MIWNEEAECMAPGEKTKLQLEKLQEVVERAYNNVPYYQKLFNEARIGPEDIETLSDLEKIPFTTKADLRDAYPFGMFAVPPDDIVEVHTSSGTTGKPTLSGYTREDIRIWSEVMARALTMAVLIKRMLYRTVMDTDSSPVGWAYITAPRMWGPLLFPSQLATPSAK